LKSLHSPHPLLLALCVILKLVLEPVDIDELIGDRLAAEQGVEVGAEGAVVVEDFDD